MTILLFSLLDEATGNATTATRIRGHLESAGHRVVALATNRDWTPAEVVATATREKAGVAIGVHAYGAGRHLLHAGIPTVIVFGGTDLNELVREPKPLAVMTQVVAAASALVVFDTNFWHRVGEVWPQATGKTQIIPQAVETCPSSYAFRSAAGLAATDRLFLLPSGLRPVKDPLFCVEEFSRWHRQDPRIQLAIVGAARDPVYARKAQEAIGALPGVMYYPPLPRADLHAAMREADAVLNSSVSESSPNAVLEAMALGTPVLVRDIPGNRSIVEHRRTGLLFTSAADCRTLAVELTQNPALGRTLAENARRMVATTHTMETERAAYVRLVAGVSSSTSV